MSHTLSLYGIWNVLQSLLLILVGVLCCSKKQKTTKSEPGKSVRQRPSKRPKYISEKQESFPSDLSWRSMKQDKTKTDSPSPKKPQEEKEKSEKQSSSKTGSSSGYVDQEYHSAKTEAFEQAPVSDSMDKISKKRIPEACFEGTDEKRETIFVQAERQAVHIHQMRDQQIKEKPPPPTFVPWTPKPQSLLRL